MLSLDARKQFLVENVIRRLGRGAGVVMDVNTGEVLAMASVPDYDPNAFIPSIDPEQWNYYNGNVRLSPFTNRAIASFTPGSTMKVPTAIAGALKGMASNSFSCDGYVAYGNHKVGCWLYNKNGGRHGGLSLSKALQQSCNPYFNKLANTIRWEGMVEGCEMVGIGKKTGIELPQEDPGVLPGSRAWRSANPDAVMTPVLTAFLSIGQGDTLATPLQLCAMAACVANGGKYYKPRIVKRVVSADGKILVKDKPDLVHDLIKEGIKPDDFERIREGMRMAVNVPGGTAGRVKLPTIEVAAKTGTAQTSDNGKASHNSWVISFAPYENPRYAICVMAQNAGSGGAVCGPLVHLIYRGLFAQDEGLRLPLKPQTEYAGHTERIEEITLPTDVIAAIEASGETGEEAGDLTTSSTVKPRTHLITPTLTADADSEGTVVPRALPVETP
jgi:penicillin-binding protein 2